MHSVKTFTSIKNKTKPLSWAKPTVASWSFDQGFSKGSLLLLCHSACFLWVTGESPRTQRKTVWRRTSSSRTGQRGPCWGREVCWISWWGEPHGRGYACGQTSELGKALPVETEADGRFCGLRPAVLAHICPPRACVVAWFREIWVLLLFLL